MNSIVKKLSEIDAAASAITGNIEVQKQQLNQDYTKKQQEFDMELEAHTTAEIQAIRRKLEEQTSGLLENQQVTSQTFICSLQKEYEEKHTEYAQAIFKRITEV